MHVQITFHTDVFIGWRLKPFEVRLSFQLIYIYNFILIWKTICFHFYHFHRNMSSSISITKCCHAVKRASIFLRIPNTSSMSFMYDIRELYSPTKKIIRSFRNRTNIDFRADSLFPTMSPEADTEHKNTSSESPTLKGPLDLQRCRCIFSKVLNNPCICK